MYTSAEEVFELGFSKIRHRYCRWHFYRAKDPISDKGKYDSYTPTKIIIICCDIASSQHFLITFLSKAYIANDAKSAKQNWHFIITELLTCMCSKRSSGSRSGRLIEKHICLNILIYSICAERTSFLPFARKF